MSQFDFCKIAFLKNLYSLDKTIMQKKKKVDYEALNALMRIPKWIYKLYEHS